MTDTLKNNTQEIITITYNAEKPSIEIYWNWWVCAIVLFTVATWIVIKYILKRKLKAGYFSRKINLKIKTKNFEFQEEIIKSYENVSISHRIFVELATRKAAVPIDPENDVIVEVYDSWYVLFTTIRNELKSLPGEFIVNHKQSETFIKLSTDILNLGLRPHLTKYQAKFRKWYDEQLENPSSLGISPQEIQKKYPDYDSLIADMKEVNELLRLYQSELKKLIN